MSLKVGLQLYSVRDEMEKDMDKTLAAVKEMGYDYVEFAGYFDKTAEEVRALLDKNGLRCVSVHQGYEGFLTEPMESAEYLKTIGASYCAIPWMSPDKHKGSDAFEKTVEEIQQVSELLKEYGIQMLYHNHDFEFEKVDGKYKLDWLYEAVGLSAICPEIDTCWVRYAGEDPCAYLKKYGDYIDVVHLKDFTSKNIAAGPVYDLIGDNRAKKSLDENDFRFRPLGQGVQDMPAILATSEEVGAQYVIVEQDHAYETPSLEAARQSREYLKSLGY